MIKGIIAKKLRMTQAFDEAGKAVVLTILSIPDNYLLQIKSKEKDGYQAVQLGAGKKKRINQPLTGHLKKAGIKEQLQFLREVAVDDSSQLKLGEKVKLEQVFQPGELVKVRGQSKGRGFAGVVKRWGFATQPKTHGQSDRERAPGSIGAQTPGRVWKGKKMPGHYGAKRKTVFNLLIVKVDEEKQQLWLKGAVPGVKGSWLLVTQSGEKKKKLIALLDLALLEKLKEKVKDGGKQSKKAKTK